MAENLLNSRVVVTAASTEEKICKNAFTFWPIINAIAAKKILRNQKVAK